MASNKITATWQQQQQYGAPENSELVANPIAWYHLIFEPLCLTQTNNRSEQ